MPDILPHKTTGAGLRLHRLLLLAGVFILLVLGLSPTGRAAALEPVTGGPAPAGISPATEAAYLRGPLKVMTLNMAHGRKTAFSQILLSWQAIHQNLTDISAVLSETAIDIVALQEADGPSWWSGDFDHVALLAKEAGFSWYARAGHMDSLSLDYGTALLARGPSAETRAHRFQPSLPTPPKGFLLGSFGWYPHGTASRNPVTIDVVSVHLDFSRESIRARQIDEMRAALRGRGNPLIILGDFNSDWLADNSVVRELTRKSGLQVYQAEATNLGTYGSRRRRLDWILISAELEFLSYRVLPDVLSDHSAVVAKIGIKP